MQINTKIWKTARPERPYRETVKTFIADVDDNKSIVLHYFPRSASHYRKCKATLIQQDPPSIIRAITFDIEPSASIRTVKEKTILNLLRDIERDIDDQSKLLTDLRRTFVTFDALEPAKPEPEGDKPNAAT